MAGAQTAPKAPQQQEPTLPEGTQEGARWINRKPEGEQVASWFKENVKLHAEVENLADKYVQGIVIIGGKERYREARIAQNGALAIVDLERMTFTPYAKVETRVAYFWDFMDARDNELGVIEPVEQRRLGEAGVYNLNLPPGFFRLPIATGPQSFVHYIGATMVVRRYKADTVEWREIRRSIYNAEGVKVDEEVREVLRGTPVAVYPPATKQISTLDRSDDEDPFSVMKAETGAVGRALGMAGMLVIPGSGIATAEDMHEAQAGAGGASIQGPATPPPATEPQEQDPEVLEQQVRDRIQEKIARLQSEDAAGYERLAAWAGEKKLDLTDPKSTALRGIELQVDRILGS